MEINQYIDIFIEESNEHLQSMNECLLKLENEPENTELLNEIFRVSHTIKGMSATMGYEKMASLTHEMENLLQELRSDKISINTDIIDILFECFDKLEQYTKNVAEQSNEGEIEVSNLIVKLNSILNDNDKLIIADYTSDTGVKNIDYYILNILKEAMKKNMKGYRITVEIDEKCMLKAARAFIVFNTLEEYSEIIKSEPSTEDIEDENFDNKFEVLIITENSVEEINKELTQISEIKSILIEELEESSINADYDQDYKEKTIKKDNLEEFKEVSADKIEKKKKTVNNKVGKTVRVDIERLDNLMNLVSELIIIKTRMEDIGDNNSKQSMNEATEYLERITTNLHDAVMKVRMVPIERVFNRFPRMVRDLSKELGKDINLKMSGEDTEVDRTVIDEIGDPLIHLIRNSIDHGIETPDKRKLLGKEAEGTVFLKAYPDGNNVVIEVQDNGSGINIDKVKQKAIENNVITEEQANQMDDKEVPELLFMPGFSTADEITDISGRGVGLDVVKSKINSIGGIVEVETKKEEYTKFTIRIPLTLAIIQALLIKLSNEIYAIPLSSIKEITTIKTEDIRKVQNQEVILYRNKTLPIIRLSSILDTKTNLNKKELITVIVKKGEKEAGFIVDELLGQQEIVIKSLGKYLSNVKYLAGATILGNGNISLILDVNSLF
ncbi:chemotaxis protein CheA [Clostridium sp. D2Q-11]|uniref:Chemotaxis protein CheA n=1 Tax=Anaeromonas frigoriresistens TaxID=2683708 RepID=A0A942UVK5_9FIRM|nr:chemotaxis protein CheA [Anaeromonas frigoriresistens]MBS4539868.1 chemotaxis protein CheA [Anaeromonas frigoriresistens]